MMDKMTALYLDGEIRQTTEVSIHDQTQFSPSVELTDAMIQMFCYKLLALLTSYLTLML